MSYTHELTLSVLHMSIQRKTSTTTTPKEKKDGKKRNGAASSSSKRPPTKATKSSESTKADTNINPVLAGILYRSKSPAEVATANANAAAAARKPVASHLSQTAGAHQALARTAVGRGIRHGYSLNAASHPGSQPGRPAQNTSAPLGNAAAASSGAQLEFPDQMPSANDSLSQLTSNYQNSLNDMSAQSLDDETMPTPLDQMRDPNASGAFGGFLLSRNSSLVDLAMIPNVDETDDQQTDFRSFGMNFVDFPNPEVYPTSENEGSCNGGESD
jgi:hypothetical protein